MKIIIRSFLLFSSLALIATALPAAALDDRQGIAIYKFSIVEREFLTSDDGAEPQTIKGRQVKRGYMIRDLATGKALSVIPNRVTRTFDSGVMPIEMTPWCQTNEAGKITEHLVFEAGMMVSGTSEGDRILDMSFAKGRAKLRKLKFSDQSTILFGPLAPVLRGETHERLFSNSEPTRSWFDTRGRSTYRLVQKLTATANDPNQLAVAFGGDTWEPGTIEFGAATVAAFFGKVGFTEGQTEVLVDEDGDGFFINGTGLIDCDDSNSAIHPLATEILGNGIDDNCDGLIDTILGGLG